MNAAKDQRREWLRRGIVPLDYPDPVAADWPDLIGIVEKKAKPERDVQKRKALRERWWHYAEKRPGLYTAISGLGRVLVCPIVSNKSYFVFLPTGMVFSHKLVVFPFECFAAYCVLQSNIHGIWSKSFSSTMKDDINYSPSDCFETFPFPEAWDTSPDLGGGR